MSKIVSYDEAVEIPETMTALEVLRQAGDFVESSYWIKSNEFGPWLEQSPIQLENGKTKGLKIKGDARKPHDPAFGYVTQACSIGAICLSRLTAVPDDDRVLISYDALHDVDLASTLACEALATVIIRELPGMYRDDPDLNDSIVPVITSWNDDSGRDRQEVVDFFRLAEQEPCLKFTELWRIQYHTLYSDYTIGRWAFGSEQACQTFLEELSKPGAQELEGALGAMQERFRYDQPANFRPYCVIAAPAEELAAV